MKKVVIFSLAALLASCSADELATGGGTVSPPAGETVTSGTVNFTNNTSLTIGSTPALTQTRLLTRSAALSEDWNGACSLDFEEVTANGNATIVDTPSYDEDGQAADIRDINGRDVVIKKGIERRIGTVAVSGELPKPPRLLENVVVVYGTFTLVNAKCENGGGRIVVCDGGVLNCNMSSLNGIDIICEDGGTVNFPAEGITIDANSEVLMYGDMNLGERDLTVNGKLYVGGDLTCQNLTLATSGAQIHVIGNANIDAKYYPSGGAYYDTGLVNISSGAEMCVEGVMTVFRITAIGAKVHVACKLIAKDDRDTSISILNGSTLLASYVEANKFHISGGTDGAPNYVYLTDEGVIDTEKLIIGNTLWIAPSQEGYSALVSATNVSIEGNVKWEDCIASTLYVNYTSVDPEDGGPVDNSKCNVCTINSTSEAECSPGFTMNEGGETDPDPDPDPDPEPEPEPEPTPEDGQIVIKIPTFVVDEYTLRADDFAIRVNGEYMEDVAVSGNTASLGDIQIVDDNLTITVSGLNEGSILEGKDYTYEVWLWVNNRTLLHDGTGGYGPLFDALKYAEWVNPDNDPYSDDDFGCDITSLITDDQVYSSAGYVVRYNVYRGLSGYVDKTTGYGDTPYIKVSIHVQRDATAREDTNVGIYPSLTGE